MNRQPLITKPRPGVQVDWGHPLNRGKVAWYLMNEGGGGAIYDTTKKSSYAALISGATWSGSPTGGGLKFDGTDDYVNIGTAFQDTVDYNKPFSLVFWFDFHTYSSTAYHCLMGHVAQRGTAYADIEIRINPNDQFECVFHSSPAPGVTDGYGWTTPVLTIKTNTPYCLVWTYDGSNIGAGGKVYFNGIDQAVTASDQGAITESLYQSGYLLGKALWLGRRNFGSGDYPFPGTIDQVMLYDRVLSNSEVINLYSQPLAGLLWPVDKSSIYSPLLTDIYDPMGMMGVFGL